ncbi:isochorismatase family protein [Streptomyces sp. DT224]|uniref:isochorismatase family protein n=1 Tax=Streptomyces sp. DT224 TaxID=3393426 RepID=UPI003CF1C301
MDVSVIDPYAMPGRDPLVENRVSWSLDARRSALVVLNMQGFFLRPYAPGTSPLDPLLAACSDLLETCRSLRVPVVHMVQPGTQAPGERGLLTDFWGKGPDDALEDAAIPHELAPDASGAVLTAWRYSAFFGSGLERHLRSLGRDQIVICGLYAHLNCVATALDAFSHNLEVFLAADAVADLSADEHRAALSWAAGCCAVVKPAAAFTAQLLGAARPVPE